MFKDRTEIMRIEASPERKKGMCRKENKATAKAVLVVMWKESQQ